MNLQSAELNSLLVSVKFTYTSSSPEAFLTQLSCAAQRKVDDGEVGQLSHVGPSCKFKVSTSLIQIFLYILTYKLLFRAKFTECPM